MKRGKKVPARWPNIVRKISHRGCNRAKNLPEFGRTNWLHAEWISNQDLKMVTQWMAPPLADSPVKTPNCDIPGVGWLTKVAVDARMIRRLAPLRKFPHSLQLVDNVTVPKSTEPIMQGSDLTRTLKFSTDLQNHLLKHEVHDPNRKTAENLPPTNNEWPMANQLSCKNRSTPRNL